VILIVDMNSKKDSLGFYEFVLPIISVVETLDSFVVRHYTEVNANEAEASDSIILSGTPLKDNATLNQTDKFGWMKNCSKPILGICAGMQTIGLIFGSKLTKCLGMGMTKVSTIVENPLFSSTFQAYSLHNYSVVPSVEFEVIAESNQCSQAIKHRQRNIYGILFHPEVRNQEILQRFLYTISKHRRV